MRHSAGFTFPENKSPITRVCQNAYIHNGAPQPLQEPRRARIRAPTRDRRPAGAPRCCERDRERQERVSFQCAMADGIET